MHRRQSQTHEEKPASVRLCPKERPTGGGGGGAGTTLPLAVSRPAAFRGCRRQHVTSLSGHSQSGAGACRGRPQRPPGRGACAALFKEVRALYRYVVVDTPPILSAS